MIRYQGFGKRFGSVVAAADIDLDVAAGETLALIGPNGSGKTTTLKALVGLVRPNVGRVTIGGIDATAGGAETRRAAWSTAFPGACASGLGSRQRCWTARGRWSSMSPARLSIRLGRS